MAVGDDRQKVIGSKLRQIRERRDCTQENLASFMREHGYPHWTQRTISYIEQGKRGLSLLETFDLARKLRYEAGTFFRMIQP